VRRILHIKRDPESTSESPRYQITDAGRYGDESGWASMSPPISHSALGDFLVAEMVPSAEIEKAFVDLGRSGSAQVDAPPRIGPRIARALFDTVCNPLIESLELELALIEKRNWTFSFRPRVLELIRPLNRYVETRAWPNYEQLLQLDPQLSAKISEHDHEVNDLLNAVARVYDVLMTSQEFYDQCESLLTAENVAEIGYPNQQAIFGAYDPADYRSLIAQYVINNSGELPSYYSSARFWNHHRQELLGSLNFRLASKTYESARDHGKRLAEISRDLVDRLKLLRGELSRRFDVPVFAGEQHQTTA
jgi:hypothetical protein